MVVGVSTITLLLHSSHSLKDKRQVLKSVIEKTKNKFNVSVAEVGDNDVWQRAELGIAAVGNDRAFVNSVLDKVLLFIEGLHLAEVTDSTIEIVNF
ncbi:MAG: cytoplasmic protein [Deltaproteobacteria bacterium GWA2_55_10]|nr:MAG: cytoplasmic protein [Deltaproteobacteria bacterium GWA2_55_10]